MDDRHKEILAGIEKEAKELKYGVILVELTVKDGSIIKGVRKNLEPHY